MGRSKTTWNKGDNIGNKNGEKYDLKASVEAFEKVYDKAAKGKFTSLQQAFIQSDLRPSTAYYLVEKFPVLENLKRDIEQAIISHINESGMQGLLNPTMCIWRQKQLGERDTNYHDVKSDNVTTVNHINLGAGEE